MSKISFQAQFKSQTLKSFDVPIKITDSNFNLLKYVHSSETIDMQPGTYHIFVKLPDGQEIHERIILDIDDEKIIDLKPIDQLPNEDFKERLQYPPFEANLRFFSGEILTERRLSEIKPVFYQRYSEGMVEVEIEGLPKYQITIAQLSQIGKPAINIVLPNGADSTCLLTISFEDENHVIFNAHINNSQADALFAYASRNELQQMSLTTTTLSFQREHSTSIDDPIVATVEAYTLLRLNQLERLNNWTKELQNQFKWLPDGALIHAEYLARKGDHKEAVLALEEFFQRGLPIFSYGLIYAIDRFKFYLSLADKFDFVNGEVVTSHLTRLRQFALFTDFQTSSLKFVGLDPIEPADTTIHHIDSSNIKNSERLVLPPDFYEIWDKDYKIERELGHGGMGHVYLATDLKTDTQKKVAIKVINERESTQHQRVERESDALRLLDHPNIIKIFDSKRTDNAYYIIMEYASGGSIRNLLETGQPIELVRKLGIGLDIADALARTHRLNILHRDIKPENILIREDGTTVLADFGLAHVSTMDNLTKEPGGTPSYMAPEIFEGRSYDERADIWSFGVTLFELLTGERLFSWTGNYYKFLEDLKSKSIPDVTKYLSGAPTALNDLIHKMLQRSPDARISSVRYVGAEIESILKGQQSIYTSRFQHLDNLPKIEDKTADFELEANELHQQMKNRRSHIVTILDSAAPRDIVIAVAKNYVNYHFRNGVLLVDMSEVSHEEELLDRIKKTLSDRHFKSIHSLRQEIIDAFKDQDLLVILDNMTVKTELTTFLNDLLATSTQLTVFAIANEKLSLNGEFIFDCALIARLRATKLLKEGFQFFRQKGRLLDDDVLKEIEDYVNKGEIQLSADEVEFLRHCRIQLAVQKWLMRSLVVIVLSLVIILPALVFTELANRGDIAFAALIVGFVVMMANLFAMLTLGWLEFRNYRHEQKLWMFPTIFGIVLVVLILLFQRINLYQNTNIVTTALVGFGTGGVLGTSFYLSLPRIPQKKWWLHSRASLGIGPLAGIILVMIVLSLSPVPTGPDRNHLWIEIPVYITTLTLTFVSGCYIADNLRTIVHQVLLWLSKR